MTKENKKPDVDLMDYLPGDVQDEDKDIKEVDLNFGFDPDDDDEDDDDDGAQRAKYKSKKPDTPPSDEDEDDEEGEDEEDEDDEGEGDDEDDSDDDDSGDEGDEDDSDDDEGDETAKKGKKKGAKPSKEPMVPKSRLDQVLAKVRELERREKAREAARPEPPKKDENAKEFDFDAAEDAYQDAVLEGDKDKAKKIRAEIRAEERKAAIAEVRSTATTASSETALNQDLMEMSAEIESEFPELNYQHKDFNEKAQKKMLSLYAGYVKSGEYKSPIAALEEALNDVVKLYNLGDKPEPKPKKEGKASIKDKVKAAKSQPPKQPGRREGTKSKFDEVDVNQLSEEEFDALPEAALARLRGDVI